ncbi:spore coat protein U domain-containing protein [Polaromonas sp.]|uniref:spore coat protein U domain-containing protein n=1 Tax=Polaromonas sp. TaxID=1869339 RepID=UPI0017ACF629|nr:spore coat protein U domain-containing protein [Polaromonas sp.]NMM05583.1 fimbrial major subunit CsuA/B family protein [Polaromonas sp.]
MKKLLSIVALSMLALSGLLTAPAHAAAVPANFNVLINLTSACLLTTPADLTFNYTSFQAGAASGSTTFNVKCTNTLPFALSLDLASVTDAATNLAYTLALSGATAAGTGVNQLITVTGTMALGQVGTCATATCTNGASANKQRILTVTY